MSDAARLRAQIPASTDPERLEREAREVEIWNRAIEAAAAHIADSPPWLSPDEHAESVRTLKK